ncbi:MAG TPA: hypothetical protein P5567_06060 [Kiritimatiellia bacterium]|nr:hypothetical protein [Kiritimatiellia bacterium]HRZ12002.1 hypothetical protein [Kiritimatiellia bacterium]HSA17192.1 hypothetical protein [Kiritimatiellia bacterium]
MKCSIRWVLLLAAGLAGPLGANAAEEEPAPEAPGFASKLLWYVPNRVMDFLDIFRLRLRVGPGLAANFRITDYGAFYAGKYTALYAGLPGPRYPHPVRWPVGFESLTGIIIAGVDATDETRHGPEYGAPELDVGGHVLLLGVDAGIDPLEIGDFVGGFLLRDWVGDDYPSRLPPSPEWSDGLSLGAGEGVFQVEPKPDRFASWSQRLDYLETNVQRRISEPLRATDAYFAMDPTNAIVPPQTQVRMKLFTRLIQGSRFSLNIEPDIELDVELPNIEKRLRVFFESARADELPERELSENEEHGLNVGARRWFEDLYLSADAGVKAKWLPQAFARLTWARDFEPGKWDLRPMQRFFVNTDDGLGSLTSLRVNRWLGEANRAILINRTSGKWTSESGDFSWSESIGLAGAFRLLDEHRRGRSIGWEDTARALGIEYTVFGDEEAVNLHRVALGLRRPLYKYWVYGEAGPGIEWNRADDFDATFFLHLGIDMLFWGAAHR